MTSSAPLTNSQDAIASNPALESVHALMQVVAQLRSPDGGCPWDLAQTPQTLMPYVIEEAYEVVDALRRENQADIVDELGDLLLQVVLQAQIASESGQFTLQDVAQSITEKLIRRHPHVFGDTQVDSVDQVRQNWEQIKATEKADGDVPEAVSAKLMRYARTLPPLLAAQKISRKAAALGFEWENLEQVWDKVDEELAELKEAIALGDSAHQQAELGDVLFALLQIARWQKLDASEGLQGTSDRFIQRLRIIESVADRPLEDYTIRELEALWQQAKKQLGQ